MPGKLTTRPFANNLLSTDLLHIVITADTAQSSSGSSYKTNIQNFAGAVSPCCITNATFNNGILIFYNVDGPFITVQQNLVFTGGPENCINQLYTNNVYSCYSTTNDIIYPNIYIQPLSGQGTVSFGRIANSSTGAGLLVDVNETSSPYAAKIALNNSLTLNANYTFQFEGKQTTTPSRLIFSQTPYSSLHTSEITFSGANTTMSQSFQTIEKNSNFPNLGTKIGYVNTSDKTFGVLGDSYVASLSQSKELAISTPYFLKWSPNATNDDPIYNQVGSSFGLGYQNIRFYPGSYASGTTAPININGINNSGRILFGFAPSGESATSIIDITGSTGYNQLRLRSMYTNTSPTQAVGKRGDIAWGKYGADYYIFVKISDADTGGHTWRKTQLFTF